MSPPIYHIISDSLPSMSNVNIIVFFLFLSSNCQNLERKASKGASLHVFLSCLYQCLYLSFFHFRAYYDDTSLVVDAKMQMGFNSPVLFSCLVTFTFKMPSSNALTPQHAAFYAKHVLSAYIYIYPFSFQF